MTYRISSNLIIDSSRNVVIGSGTTRPSSPATGTLWFNTSTGVLEGWNGSTWVALTTA